MDVQTVVTTAEWLELAEFQIHLMIEPTEFTDRLVWESKIKKGVNQIVGLSN